MASKMELLECPMCDFTIPPKDHGDYVLLLHFEQVHTTDSPFVVEDDPEPLPPSIPLSPSSKRKHAVDTPSDDSEEDEGTVVCHEPDCGEVVSLPDFNDHLDYHTAETLSFDEVRPVREHYNDNFSTKPYLSCLPRLMASTDLHDTLVDYRKVSFSSFIRYYAELGHYTSFSREFFKEYLS
jgi:hypothetical protein